MHHWQSGGVGCGGGVGICSHSSHSVVVTMTGGGVGICSHSSQSVSVTMTGGGIDISSHSGQGTADADMNDGRQSKKTSDRFEKEGIVAFKQEALKSAMPPRIQTSDFNERVLTVRERDFSHEMSRKVLSAPSLWHAFSEYHFVNIMK